jgi:hypothetical protein
LKRQPKQIELYTTESRLIDLLDRELQRAHANEDFMKGKIERLELAAFTHGSPVAKEYVSRTDSKPIETTPVEREPRKKTWKEVQAEWNSMTPEQQEAALAKGAN